MKKYLVNEQGEKVFPASLKELILTEEDGYLRRAHLLEQKDSLSKEALWKILDKDNKPIFVDYVDTSKNTFIKTLDINPATIDMTIEFELLEEGTPWSSICGCRALDDPATYCGLYISGSADKLYTCWNLQDGYSTEVVIKSHTKYKFKGTGTEISLNDNEVIPLKPKYNVDETQNIKSNFYLGTTQERSSMTDTNLMTNTNVTSCRIYNFTLNGYNFKPAFYQGLYGLYIINELCDIERFYPLKAIKED